MLPDKTVDMDSYFSALSSGTPYKTYKKTILGKVYVNILNMLTGTPTPEGVILEGDPRKNDTGSMIDVWSKMEDYYLHKMNKSHFDSRTLIEYKRNIEIKKEKTVDDYSDEELKTLINKPFLALKNTLNKTTSVGTLFRIQTLAGELEKSAKVMEAIESRLSEVQESQTPKMPQTIEEEL